MSQVQDYNQYQMVQVNGVIAAARPTRARLSGVQARQVGVISRNRRAASANASAQADQIVKNCMRGRGYNVLN